MVPLYFVKPIVWNTRNYVAPSGGKFTSGYPKDHGFGHEEWNNSPQFEFEDNGQVWRVFHTEGFGKQALDNHAGDIVVFMVASHDSGQYLIGVAGGATSLIGDPHRNEREEIVRKCRLGGSRWKEAWALQSVQTCYKNDVQEFRRHWDNELHLTPTWKCIAELFLWLRVPAVLDPGKITGKKRLIGMYGSYQEISRSMANAILSQIPEAEQAGTLTNLRARCGDGQADMAADIAEVRAAEKLKPTSREALIQARLGQGRFRQELMTYWGQACAVTGCRIPQALRASHIRPWRESSNRQRLDPNNGLLLEATLDALFDAGLIAFSDTGEMIVSNEVQAEDRRRLGIPRSLRQYPNAAQQKHLAYHRMHVRRSG